MDNWLKFLDKLLTVVGAFFAGAQVGEAERKKLDKENQRLDIKNKELQIDKEIAKEYSGLSDDDAINNAVARLRSDDTESK